MPNVLEQLIQKAPDIIREAAATPAGIAALVILALAALGAFLFRSAPVRNKLIVFGLLTIAFIGLSVTARYEADPAMVRIDGHVFDASTKEDIGWAKVHLELPDLAPHVTDTEGMFH